MLRLRFGAKYIGLAASNSMKLRAIKGNFGMKVGIVGPIYGEFSPIFARNFLPAILLLMLAKIANELI
jgi:hypothetical protein